MQPFEENSVSIRPPARFSPPSARLAAAVLAMIACLAVFLGLGHNWGYPEERPRSTLPGFRYVNSGWISPVDWRELGPLERELRAFIIVSQDELDEFESGFASKVSRGNPTSLGRIDFDTSVLLAAYYAWLPVRGDPFSVAGVLIDDNEALVSMALEGGPTGPGVSVPLRLNDHGGSGAVLVPAGGAGRVYLRACRPRTRFAHCDSQLAVPRRG